MLMQQVGRVLLNELEPQVCDLPAVIEEASRSLHRMVVDVVTWPADEINRPRRRGGAGTGVGAVPALLDEDRDRAVKTLPANTIEPADLVQETFLAAHRGIAVFQGSTEGQWRLAEDHPHEPPREPETGSSRRPQEGIRAVDAPGRRRRGGPGSKRGHAPSSSTPDQERDRAIRAALKKLPEHYREIVVWHHDDGLTFEAVGDRLGISADAARKR